MHLSRGRLYTLLLFLTASGYLWLLVGNDSGKTLGWTRCLIRYIFHIPCPSCGTTRSVREMFRGEWLSALYYNPIGVLLAVLMVVIPIWIVADLLMYSSSFLRAYRQTEKIFQRRLYAFIGIVAILINWIWNFQKYL